MKRFPSRTCCALSQLRGSRCHDSVGLFAMSFHQKMWHLATGCVPKKTAPSTSWAAFRMQSIEPSMSKQDWIQGERPYTMASLALLDVMMLFVRYTDEEKGEKKSLWCFFYVLF